MDTRVTRKRVAGSRTVASGRPAATSGAHPQAGDAERRLALALARLDDLAEQVFVLQEQNQQLRRDLAQHVCPRLCTKPFRGAS